jgi:hypothetical protein
MCKEQTLEEQVCYLRRENEVLKEKVSLLEELIRKISKEDKGFPTVIVEGGEVTVID